MKQQVNLYGPVFKPREVSWSGASLFKAAGLVLAAVLAVHGYALFEVERLDREVAALAAQRDAAAVRLAGLGQLVVARTPDADLARRARTVAATLTERRAVVSVLADRESGASTGFSAYLEALARQRVEGLWLTAVRLDGAGQDIEIEGSALTPDLVPTLVRRLGDEPSFREVGFRSLIIDRAEVDDARVDFVLRSVSGGTGS